MNALTIKETEVLNAFNNYFKRFNKTAWQMTEIYGNTVPWATPVQIGYIYWEIESAMLRAGIQVQRDFHKDYVDALVDLQKRGWIELLPTDLFDNVYRMTKEGAEVLKGIQ